MKRFFMAIAAISLCMAGFAQKNTEVKVEVQYENTQARLLDVTPNSYVKPLTVELEVAPTPLLDSLTLNLMQVKALEGDPANIRSKIVYEASQKWECDVIVAPTFYITSVPTGYKVKMKGFPAKFKNWKTASKEDYEWIRIEHPITTSQYDQIDAYIRK